MLIQTIKSRNLWLWGETVVPSSESSEANKLKSDIQDLSKQRTEKSIQLDMANKKLMNDPENSSIQKEHGAITKKLQESQSSINADIEQKQEQLKEVQNINSGGEVNNIKYTREYTTPFKITALQSIDIQWDNPVGESYGIKTNFLQAWHNKPVNINFTGLSYIGSFGGETVGNLAQEVEQENQSKFDKFKSSINSSLISDNVTGNISKLMNTVQDATNSDTADYAKGKYYTVVDDDIYQINKLMSLYGEGMFSNANADISSSWIHLVLENEPNENGTSQYAAFVGHIRNFTYKERVDKPFLYEFTCQFVGEPTISEKVGQGKIEAKQDSNALKLSLVTSNSGYSLGYGF